MPVLSICFTVYNQIDMLRMRLDNISQYEGSDIEVVISDDCSTDNIEDLVKSYKDDRFVYYKTPFNLGHDKNILFALQASKAPFALVLRTRDGVCIKKLNEVINLIYKNKCASYFLFSAVFENGNVRMKLKNKKYKKGLDAIKAHEKLLIHPSGSIYNTSYLDIEKYNSYLDKCFDDIYGFTVHQLIRMDLATKGEFITSDILGWIYADTSKAKDVAVNSGREKKNVYSPEYQYPRYKCEFLFANNEFKNPEKQELLKYIVNRYFISIISDFQIINDDVSLQRHYNSETIDFNEKQEMSRFVNTTIGMAQGLNKNSRSVIHSTLRRTKILLITYYPFMRAVRKTIINNRILNLLYRKIRYRENI